MQLVASLIISKDKWKLEGTDEAIKAELHMLFKDLLALRAVKRAAIKGGTKILCSHMFVVAKYLASGAFDKIKARLIADGRDQDAEMFPNKSSPTVAVHSMFTVLGLAASKPWRVVAKVDIKGAFVQTPMQGEPVYTKIDPKITKYAVELIPELKKMVEADGCLYTVMLKAMYGCVQASALWYALIRKLLEDFGYTVSETDRCVFRKEKNGRIFILLLYVDDILAVVDEQEAKELKAMLVKRFGMVQFAVGNNLSYLGMQISIRNSGTIVSMSFYVQQLLEGLSVAVKLPPGTKTTFVVDESSPPLEEGDRKVFHSQTAKVLYLAKQSRPDTLTVVSFLCTRVQSATEEDRSKLDHILGYLKGTQDHTLLLQAQSICLVTVYVDAAFGLHNDIMTQGHTEV